MIKLIGFMWAALLENYSVRHVMERFVSAWPINLGRSIETWRYVQKPCARSCLKSDKKEWGYPRILLPGKRLFKNWKAALQISKCFGQKYYWCIKQAMCWSWYFAALVMCEVHFHLEVFLMKKETLGYSLRKVLLRCEGH